MPIPNLKRVRITSAHQLSDWLGRNSEIGQSVMLVIHRKDAANNQVSAAELRAVLDDHGWQSGFRYTLNADLVGHVASPGSVR